jgi:hypothetical protein
MKKKYKVFSLAESEKWHEYYDRIEKDDKDIYYTIAIIAAFEKFENTQALLFIFEEDDNLVYYPFFKRSIARSNYFDITTQFTYGGPLFKITNNRENFISNFRTAFSEYCKEDGIVSELIRFHPFINSDVLLNSYVEIKEVNNGIYMDLEKTVDQIKKEYHPKVKCQINKAIRNGYHAVFSNQLEDLNSFFSIYEHTMIRNDANNSFYFLDREFLQLLLEQLKDNFEFIFIEKEGVYVSTELVLFSDKYVNGVIGGTLKEFFNEHPNRLLRHAIALRYLDKKQTKFVIGTGITKGDNLFEYKKRFCPDGVYKFQMGMKIHNKEIYNELVEKRKQNFPDQELNLNFFPLYRS